MNIKDFIAGTYKSGYNYNYFVPEKINHSFIWNDETINELLEKASLKLGELNSFSRFVPDTDRFIMAHVMKEAVVSSKIEGTQTNIAEAFTNEGSVNPERRDDWKEVQNYTAAINNAVKELAVLPISSRLIRNTHAVLLSGVRGSFRSPGEFRTSQNWIGGANINEAVFVPPAHTELPELVADLEMFLHNGAVKVPHLIRIAIVHYQFETIHPFLDGNGRIGRLLITLYLVSSGILEKPLLYLSEYFEKNRSLYYDNLTAVRKENDLAKWIRFFLTGVVEIAERSVSTLRKIIELKETIQSDILPQLGRRTKQGNLLLLQLFKKPVVTVKDIQELTGLSPKSANTLAEKFAEVNILKETTGFQRNRIFMFDEYLKMF